MGGTYNMNWRYVIHSQNFAENLKVTNY